MKNLDKKLKDARLRDGLSLRDLEKLVGVSFSTLARIERGVGSCTPDTLSRLTLWLESGECCPKRQVRGKAWHVTTEQRLARIEAHLDLAALAGEGNDGEKP